MRRSVSAAIIAVAIAAVPSLARAVTPEVHGRVIGMSELPDHVQDAVRREASRSGDEIGELRSAGHGLYRAELVKNGHGEIVTFHSDGSVVERREY
jgi:hypothetical protein